MITGDSAYIKKINRRIILENIIKHGMISRADLSKITNLNKATISAQIADLLEEELVCETQQVNPTVGRRPIMVSINAHAGYVLGIDLNYKQIEYNLSDLQGNPVLNHIEQLQTDEYEEIINILMTHIKKYNKMCLDTRFGLVNVVIGVHGTVDKNESVNFVTEYQWYNKNLKADLKKKLDLNIHIENNANLSAYAEKVYKHYSCQHLISIEFSPGVGAGIIVDGTIQKGYHGYAGEVGHMILYPRGKPCKCGNKGCWGLYTSTKSFLSKLSNQLNQTNLTMKDVKKLINEDDAFIQDHIDPYIFDLSIGLNNIINSYNPETLVLNSEILQITPNALEKIKHYLSSSVSHYCKISLSNFGNKATIMGACALAIQRFLEVPELILTNLEETN
ncbi:ROK family transcriptional regulator [Bacillus sp. V3B]|uniref:ROK family transcriptional regulator n=1 Tax=Bacillus sp. V3B TaxID=2804915 RepID=UPI00210D0D0E|nr:ROK family transcriptional regulator [Bacillus sp. V3B]MCQ6275651.1 ROK family transcriptional regulator [Bacillus sp. V3B]